MQKNPIDDVLKAKAKRPPAWRLIYERIEEIEAGIIEGKMHKDFAKALGISVQGYNLAKNKAYLFQRIHGKFEKEE